MKTLLVATTLLTPVAMASDPIARYPFETQTGGITPEFVSGGAQTATLGPSASIAGNSRRLGTASLRLRPENAANTVSGGDGAITANEFSWATDTRTIAFWVRASVDQTDTLPTMISLGNGAANGTRFDLRLQTGNTGTTGTILPGGLLRCEIQGGFVESTTADMTNAGLSFTNLRDGQWHHIAVVVPTATASVHSVLFYIDGVPVAHSIQGTNQAINTGNGPLRIGDSFWDNARDFKGYLDDVRIYTVALSPEEIAALYSADLANASAIAAFDAEPELLANGGTTTLSWITTGSPSAISIDRGIGDVSSLTQTAATVTGEGTVTYTLSVTTAKGTEAAPLDLRVLGPLQITNPQLLPTGFQFTVNNLVPGTLYQAEYSFDLGDANGWTNLGAAFPGPASTTTTIIDVAASPDVDPKVFYRVSEVSNP